MSKYVHNESSFYNGISQQNPELRLETQVEDAVNTKLSVANGVEKRPSAGLLLEEADEFELNCKGHELELDDDNQFIMVFNSNVANKPHTAYNIKGSAHKIITQDANVDLYLGFSAGTFNPDKDLRLTTVLSTTLITNKNVSVSMWPGAGTGLTTAKYLYFRNGVQQVTREVTVGGNIWSSAKETNNDTEVLVDDFITFLGSTAGYTGTRISDSIVKVVKDDAGAFVMSATDSYSDTTMKVAPVAGTELEALPPKAVDDEIIKIIAEDSSDASYYLQYDSTSDAWFETVLPGTEVDFNDTTMPHKIEYLEDTDGSVTGTTGEFYFYVSRITWAPRTTGDVDNSPHPSFVGKTVNDIFFFKNRLGLVSTDTVICSAVDDIYNFWPKTVKEVLDDDPVDLSIATTRNVTLEYAEVFPDSMAIIGNNTQYSLHSDGKPFTNQNATMDVTTSYEVSPLVKPKSVGSSLYMVVPRDSYSAVREYAVIPDTLVTDAVDITGHVPRFIPESVKQIATDNSLGHVFLLDKELSNDKYTLWNYSFYWQGNEKVQSAWSKWDFWFQPKAMGIFNSALYVVGSEATETGMQTIMVKLRLETNTVEVLNYLNPEPLVDRLQLFPDSVVTSVGTNSTILEVGQALYDSVDYIDPNDLVLVDRLSGASGSYTLRYEQGGRYFLQFDFNVISKFNFFLNDNSTLVGAHKIGGNILMAKLTTANNAVTVLDGDLSSSATTLVLTDIANFPVLSDVDDYCILTLIRESDGAIEYVKCTTQNIPNRSYEILRGQESTIPLDFSDGDGARNLLTADQIETLRTASVDKLPLVGGTLSGDLDLGGNTLDNVKTAVNPDEGVNLQQVEDLIDAIPTPTDDVWAHVTNGNQISPTISDGVGISSIQRLSKGQYTFFLSSPMSSASPNIIIDFTPVAFTGSSSVIQYDKSTSSASTIFFVAYDLSGNLTDSTEFLIRITELL